jgi:hypothetical protein
MSARGRLTAEEQAALAVELKRRIESKTRDLTCRNCIEFIISVYVLGALPLGMHWLVVAVSNPSDFTWIPPETALFVMVTCAAAFGDAWQDRRREDDTMNLLIAIFGGLGTLTGALAYALMMLKPPAAASITAIFQAAVWPAAFVVAILYLLYRLPDLRKSAGEEAERKIAEAAKMTRKALQKS